MIALLDTIGPAVWRASWQAAVLALVVLLLVRSLGNASRRGGGIVLWSVVVLRLLLVATPASPWSAFNLARLDPGGERRGRLPRARPSRRRRRMRAAAERHVERAAGRPVDGRSLAAGRGAGRETSAPASRRARDLVVRCPPRSRRSPRPSADRPTRASTIVRILSSAWLAGCLVSGLQLLGAALVLRRRLSACRPVTDAAVLAVLETACRQDRARKASRLAGHAGIDQSLHRGNLEAPHHRAGIDRHGVLVHRIRHVLAHELAHLVRGDLWTNWLLLTARIVHWFNPVAWWTIREMQAECEAACDELAVAALGEADRSAYASTLIDLAASVAPSGMAPAMIGLISSTRRLTTRVERLARSPSVTTLRSPVGRGHRAGDRPRRPDRRHAGRRGTSILGDGHVRSRDQGRPRGQDRHPPRSLHRSRRRLGAGGSSRAIVQGAGADRADRRGREHPSPIAKVASSSPASPRRASTIRSIRSSTWSLPRPTIGRSEWAGSGPGSEGDQGESIDIRFLARRRRSPARCSTRTAGPSRARRWLSGPSTAGRSRASCRPRPAPTVVSRSVAFRTTNGCARAPRIDPGLSVHRIPSGLSRDELEVRELPRNVTVTLPVGCRVTGTVTDARHGTACRRCARWWPSDSASIRKPRPSTDAAGRFAMALPEDRYNFFVRAKDRVCVAITDRECLAGQRRSNCRRSRCINGGFIAGRVVNASTGQPIAATEQGTPDRDRPARPVAAPGEGGLPHADGDRGSRRPVHPAGGPG